MLEIKNVSKRFREKVAVNNINLNIEKGQVFGLLGPNGAGKSTLMRLILNILIPDNGIILWNGIKNSEIPPNKLGYLPEMRGLYPTMKVIDHITFFLQLKGFNSKDAYKIAEKWLLEFELIEWKDKKVKKLSKGMQQKVQLICAFANIPELLILDEPFSGLDPINAKKLEKIIPFLLENGTQLIILSTHQMEYAEKLCDNVALINNGQIVRYGNIDKLKTEFFNYIYTIKTLNNINIPEDFPYDIVESKNNYIKIKSDKPIILSHIADILEKKLNNTIIEFKPELPTLREIFIKSIESYENTQHFSNS